jgi:hypothetical protein
LKVCRKGGSATLVDTSKVPAAAEPKKRYKVPVGSNAKIMDEHAGVDGLAHLSALGTNITKL